MKQKFRADILAFQQNLAESREKARALIMAGRVAFLDGSKVDKPGSMLSSETRLELVSGKDYVSRGARKLLTLLDGFNMDVSSLVCLDAGASTGGFTDCLLQRGAAKVYAVDVGTNQLHEKLKKDARVVSIEKTNLRDAPFDLIPEKIDLLTADLSFISLTLVLPACDQWLKPGGRAALLIKPQFELSPSEVCKGVVKSEEKRQKAVAKIADFCADSLNWTCAGVLPAQIKGPKGNQEYMALFQKQAK